MVASLPNAAAEREVSLIHASGRIVIIIIKPQHNLAKAVRDATIRLRIA
jgi:hypothetical protein